MLKKHFSQLRGTKQTYNYDFVFYRIGIASCLAMTWRREISPRIKMIYADKIAICVNLRNQQERN